MPRVFTTWIGKFPFHFAASSFCALLAVRESPACSRPYVGLYENPVEVSSDEMALRKLRENAAAGNIVHFVYSAAGLFPVPLLIEKKIFQRKGKDGGRGTLFTFLGEF